MCLRAFQRRTRTLGVVASCDGTGWYGAGRGGPNDGMRRAKDTKGQEVIRGVEMGWDGRERSRSIRVSSSDRGSTTQGSIGLAGELPDLAVTDDKTLAKLALKVELAYFHTRAPAAHKHRPTACSARTLLPRLNPIPYRIPMSIVRHIWQIFEYAADRHLVYVHCTMGYQRTATVCAL